jgi:Conserved region in glutamate synthase
MSTPGAYRRYHISTQHAPNIVAVPPRFRVRVKKHRLAQLLLKELVHFRGNLPVVLSRPCVYGVFSGPVGGFAPREELCVGCLRCTVQYPDVVQIQHNPKRGRLGDSYLVPDYVATILYEATTGRVPVHGAGYRGPFGGDRWDGMWLDMSEIVRPTRDGIHGREFISTAVDIGEKPAILRLAEDGSAVATEPRLLALPLPFLFDTPPSAVQTIVAEAARELETLAVVPVESSHVGGHVVPLVERSSWPLLNRLAEPPAMIALDGWDATAYEELGRRFPESLVCVRVPADANVLEPVRGGARVLHLVADYHGQAGERFVLDLICEAHRRLVEEGVREEVTLIGSGGIVLAEHVPKAIACGLDAVALDTALWVALQGRFLGECRDRDATRVSFGRMTTEWGVRRLKNLSASWRDQLLEVLGAMGMREVRRLRGELGRCMFQHDLEREAFEGIEGYA